MRQQRGMTLVEVLVAAAVLAFGVIGLVLLQAQSLRGATVATNGVDGGVLANQLAEQIRMNPSAAADYIGLSGASCAVTPYATRHLDDYCSVYNALTANPTALTPNLAVTCLNCPNAVPRYRVTVSWMGKNATGAFATVSYSVDFVISEGT